MAAKVVLKNRVQIGSTVDKVIWEQFQTISKETLVPISKLLDRAMQEFIDKYNKKGTI